MEANECPIYLENSVSTTFLEHFHLEMPKCGEPSHTVDSGGDERQCQYTSCNRWLLTA